MIQKMPAKRMIPVPVYSTVPSAAQYNAAAIHTISQRRENLCRFPMHHALQKIRIIQGRIRQSIPAGCSISIPHGAMGIRAQNRGSANPHRIPSAIAPAIRSLRLPGTSSHPRQIIAASGRKDTMMNRTGSQKVWLYPPKKRIMGNAHSTNAPCTASGFRTITAPNAAASNAKLLSHSYRRLIPFSKVCSVKPSAGRSPGAKLRACSE